MSSARPSSIISARPTSRAQELARLKSAAPGNSGRSSQNVRQSAYVPRHLISAPSQPKFLYSRRPDMITYKFKHFITKIDRAQVEFSLLPDAQTEYISIAGDWKAGLQKARKHKEFYETGYLGSGSAKQVVYVRFFFCYFYFLTPKLQARIGTQEYAVGQSSDPVYTASQNRVMLTRSWKPVLILVARML
jgi:hypothetical protein